MGVDGKLGWWKAWQNEHMTESELEAKRFQEADQRFEAGDTPNRRRFEESVAQARAGLGIEMTVEELYKYASGEIVEKNGMYVWTGDVPDKRDLREILESTWEERVDVILGDK